MTNCNIIVIDLIVLGLYLHSIGELLHEMDLAKNVTY